LLNFIKNNLQILNIHGCDFLHQIYMEYNSFFIETPFLTKSGLESITKLNWNPNFVSILVDFVLFWLILVDQNQKNLNFVSFWWTKIKKSWFCFVLVDQNQICELILFRFVSHSEMLTRKVYVELFCIWKCRKLN